MSNYRYAVRLAKVNEAYDRARLDRNYQAMSILGALAADMCAIAYDYEVDPEGAAAEVFEQLAQAADETDT